MIVYSFKRDVCVSGTYVFVDISNIKFQFILFVNSFKMVTEKV